MGVIVGLTAEQIACASTWLLPFTAGGFLYIALVSIVPDLLEVGMGSEKKSLWTVVEVGAVGLGVVVMALVTIVEKKSCGYVLAHFFFMFCFQPFDFCKVQHIKLEFMYTCWGGMNPISFLLL